MVNTHSDQNKLYVHYGARFFRKERMPEVKNGWHYINSKPSGGLWASPVDAKYGWIEYCKGNDLWPNEKDRRFKFWHYEPDNRFFFKLQENAVVYHIFCMEDLFNLPERSGYVRDEDHTYRIDFEKAVKEGIDAIELHLSDEKPCDYDKQLRFQLPYWDCDCILIMNPKIVDTDVSENRNKKTDYLSDTSLRTEVKEIFEDFDVEYFEIEDGKIIFVYDNAEFTIFPDNSWSESISYRAGKPRSNKGWSIEQLRCYFQWIDEVKNYCYKYGYLRKGIDYKVSRIDGQY